MRQWTKEQVNMRQLTRDDNIAKMGHLAKLAFTNVHWTCHVPEPVNDWTRLSRTCSSSVTSL